MPSRRIYSNISDKHYQHYRAGFVSPRSSEGWKGNNQYVNQVYESSGSVWANDAFFTSVIRSNSARNRAIKEFTAQARGESAQLAVNAAEWSQSMAMIETNARRLRFLWNALTLRRLSRKGKPYNLRPSQLWLEYWLGWAPLISDIYTSIDILQQYPRAPIKLRGAATWRSERVEYYNSKDRFKLKKATWRGSVSVYGKAVIENYNLHIADQLGLVNPALAAWQLARLSFVVDWFVNVSQVLDALVPFAGLSISETGEAYWYTGSGFLNERLKQWDYDLGKDVDVYINGGHTLSVRSRTPTGLPRPSLTMSFDRLALTRAATSVSLLVEALSSKRK